MMNCREVIQEAIERTFIQSGSMDVKKGIRLAEIDEKYDMFYVTTELVDRGKVFYFLITLFFIEEDDDIVPLACLSNIGYTGNEAVCELAKIMARAIANYCS